MPKAITYLSGVKVTLSRTANGAEEYLQILSDDQFRLNIVLVAEEFEVRDERPKPEPEEEGD